MIVSMIKIAVMPEKRDEILEILGRDPDTRTDIFKIIPDFAYELIVMEEMERDDSFRVQMKKRIDIRNR